MDFYTASYKAFHHFQRNDSAANHHCCFGMAGC